MWKTLALMSMSISALMALGVGYAVLAYGSNLRKIAAGAPLCWGPNSREFDGVAAAQMLGRLDLVSFLLTTGAIGLAIFSLMGWWLIRREAKDEAREVAANEARRIAQEYYSGQNKSETEHDKTAKESYISDTPKFDVKDVSVAGAEEEKETGNDQPK